MIGIVNYGLGNVKAFCNVYDRLKIPAIPVSTTSELEQVNRIILPGVGSFDWAMSRLNSSGMRSMLDHLVLEKGIPVLGVCVGFQIMAKLSDEGSQEGLGWFDAKITKFDEEVITNKTYLPHMGWNDVITVDSLLFSGISSPNFYFLHSYYFDPHNPEYTIGITDYNKKFVSAASNRNIYGVQFHPEKSHENGIKLLLNFSEI